MRGGWGSPRRREGAAPGPRLRLSCSTKASTSAKRVESRPSCSFRELKSWYRSSRAPESDRILRGGHRGVRDPRRHPPQPGAPPAPAAPSPPVVGQHGLVVEEQQVLQLGGDGELPVVQDQRQVGAALGWCPLGCGEPEGMCCRGPPTPEPHARGQGSSSGPARWGGRPAWWGVTIGATVPRRRLPPQLGSTARSRQEQEGEKPPHGAAGDSAVRRDPGTGPGGRRASCPRGQSWAYGWVRHQRSLFRLLPALRSQPAGAEEQPLAGLGRPGSGSAAALASPFEGAGLARGPAARGSGADCKQTAKPRARDGVSGAQRPPSRVPAPTWCRSRVLFQVLLFNVTRGPCARVAPVQAPHTLLRPQTPTNPGEKQTAASPTLRWGWAAAPLMPEGAARGPCYAAWLGKAAAAPSWHGTGPQPPSYEAVTGAPGILTVPGHGVSGMGQSPQGTGSICCPLPSSLARHSNRKRQRQEHGINPAPARHEPRGTGEGASSLAQPGGRVPRFCGPSSKGGDEPLAEAPGTCPQELNCSLQGNVVPREGGQHPRSQRAPTGCAQLGAEAAQCRVCHGSGAEPRAGTCPPRAQCQGRGGGPWCSRSGASLAWGCELARSLCPRWSAPRLSAPPAGKGEQRGAKPPYHLHQAARLLWAGERAGREVAWAGHIPPRSPKPHKEQARRRTRGGGGDSGVKAEVKRWLPR